MRKNLISLVAGLALLSGLPAAHAANLPLFTGPLEAGNLVGILNTLTQRVNSGVGGLLNAQTGAVATGAGTSEQILQQYVAPASTLSAAGQGLRITCWGTTGANTNVKTRKLYFGAAVITTAAEAANAQNWRLELVVMRTGAATQSIVGQGLAGTGGVTPLSYINQGTIDLTAAVTVKCTGTDGTDSAADITANGMLVELIK